MLLVAGVVNVGFVRATIAAFEQAQAIAQLQGRNEVCREDVEKAARIRLEGRTEISPSSQYYETPDVLFCRLLNIYGYFSYNLTNNPLVAF